MSNETKLKELLPFLALSQLTNQRFQKKQPDNLDMNEYLASFPGATMDYNMGVTELNEIFLNIMTNSWYKQAYVQDFDGESISFKRSINMFERMEISEIIYEDVVTSSY